MHEKPTGAVFPYAKIRAGEDKSKVSDIIELQRYLV